MDGIEATSPLVEHPDKMDIIITGPFSGPFLKGEAFGLSGGHELMPVAYVGDDMCNCKPDDCDPHPTKGCPTPHQPSSRRFSHC